MKTRMRQLQAFLYFCMERDYLPKFKTTILKADEVIKEPLCGTILTSWQ